jgi:hypothetical protein
LPKAQNATETLADQFLPNQPGSAHKANEIGTYVFGTFSAISLLVSLIKGIEPIYLLESAGWAGAAWYWHRKKMHSQVSKAIVVGLAVLVGLGEVIHMVIQAAPRSPQTSFAG